MLAIQDRREAIDNLTVIEELRNREQLDSIGGASYITFLINNTPTHIHAETYARIVERAAIRRRLLNAAQRIGQVAMEESSEIDEVIKAAQAQVLSASRRRNTERHATRIGDVASTNYSRVEQRYQAGGGIQGIPTGFTGLDSMLGGLEESTLTVLGARPKMGKTAWMLSVALNVAQWLRKVGHPGSVLFYSLEMSKEALTQRCESMLSGIHLQKLTMGALDELEWCKYTEALALLGTLPIYIDDTPALSVRNIETLTQRHTLDYGDPAVIFVDYLQLVRASRATGGYSVDARPTEIEDAAYGLSAIAKMFRSRVVSGAQVKQDVEQRKDKRPAAYDLAGSDGILRAADAVITLYRDRVYKPNANKEAAELNLVANRSGRTDCGHARWQSDLTYFSDDLTLVERLQQEKSLSARS
jgi:replicative DNA helicase